MADRMHTSLESAQTIFMLGIAGTGMRGLAYLLAAQGKQIRGTDDQFTTSRDIPSLPLISPDQVVIPADAPKILSGSDVLIHTDAVGAEHPMLVEARGRGIPVLSYQAALGELSQQFVTIAVAGTHGKSSTTAFLAHIMIEAGLDPTVLIGAHMPSLPAGHARLGNSAYFIVEADEYREHFLSLTPEWAIITNVDFDHPDFFTSKQEVEQLFVRFQSKVKRSTVVGFELADSALFSPSRLVTVEHDQITQMPAALPGEHMRHNAALAVQMAEQLGVQRAQAIASLRTFPGLSRRFEMLGTLGTTSIISDYGHHPAAIENTLAAARELYPEAVIGVLFEPHMRERLEAFESDFAQALSQADMVWLYPIFHPSGRGDAHDSQSLQTLLEDLHDQHAAAEILGDVTGLSARLQAADPAIDILLAFSAGRLDAELRGVQGLKKA